MLNVKEKVAYGLGDTASNIVFQTVMLFLTFFYTDIFGISPAVVGTMFLVIRMMDAITDPLMGALADRTRTRWGAFRPYLLWLALPFALCSMLAFTTPDLSDTSKVWYAYLTYGLLMLMYTAINIPYCALGGVLSTDPDERVSVQTYRFVFGMLGGLIVTAFTLPMVEYFGQGDRAKGYQLTMAIMSSFGFVMFLLCFLGTKERVAPSSEERVEVKKQLGVLWANSQWRILCLVAVLLLTGMVLRNTLAIYYVKDVLGLDEKVTFFVTLGMVGNLLGCACAYWIVKRTCKVKVYIRLQLIAALICVASYFVPSQQPIIAFGLYFLWCFFLQMATPLLWAKIADTIDYGHWQSGVKITGITYATVIFFIKLGVALGGACGGWLLASYGYEAGSEQSETTKHGILLSFTLIPAIASVLVALTMRYYRLDKNMLFKIQHEIAAKT